MGLDFSYNCIDVSRATRVATYPKDLYLVDLQFEDEHGHKLAPLHHVLVVVEGGVAKLEKYPENILDSAGPTEDTLWPLVEGWCRNHPGYDVENSEKLARWVVAEADAK
jgi:hypothetical protein